MSVKVAIVPTGTANLASVLAAFRRLGAEPFVVAAATEVASASHVMLPGVGAFGASLEELRAKGLDRVLIERLAADRPTIAICVGHQLLFRASAESPGAVGLGLAEADIERFPEGVRVPQFGWNKVKAEAGSRLLDSGYAYFANSYRASAAPGWEVATAEHGGPFVAAMACGNVLGCQFHPELSSDFGAALLSRFLELG